MRGYALSDVFDMPLGGRTEKPRDVGITFVSDFGFGLNRVRDYISVAADFIDRVKIVFGSAALYDEELLREKIHLLRTANIEVNPGGTCAEIAVYCGAYDKFLKKIKDLGFTTVEVSDGTIRVDDATREAMIKKALDMGFKVVSEVGKKDESENLNMPELLRQIKRDLRFGVSKVTLEARGTAKGLGVFDSSGKVKDDEVDLIVSEVDVNRIIWEAPTKDPQVYFINKFGPNVNLGNIRVDEIVMVEGMRRGLRGDTFRMALRQGASS